MYMPWGKYQGEPLQSIPGSYLFWCLEECDRLPPELEASIRTELARRLGATLERPSQNIIDSTEIVSWCRRAALVAHPDHGGDGRMMKMVNELRARFQA